MTTQIRSTSDQMVLGRMFGHRNPDTYSPAEYASTVGPVLETKLRESPVKVANSYLEPHNSGVRLSLVFENTYTVRSGGKSPNEVLVEHGAASQQDFDLFVGGLFEMADKMTDITLIDAIGNSKTFRREDVKTQTQRLAEKNNGPLDLSAFEGNSSLPLAEDAAKYQIVEARITDSGSMWTFGVRAGAGEAGPLTRVRPGNYITSVKPGGGGVVWFDVDESNQSKARKALEKELKHQAGVTLESQSSQVSEKRNSPQLGRGARYSRPKPDSVEKGSTRLKKKLKRGAKSAGRAAGRAIKKAGKAAGRAVFGKRRKRKQEGISEKLDWDVDRMGNVTIFDPMTREDVFIQGEEGQQLADELENAPNSSVEQMILDQYTTLFDEALMEELQDNDLAEDVAAFLGETADFPGAAEKLLADSENMSRSDPFHKGQQGLGYRAYLRQVVARRDPGYLTRNEDTDIRAGAIQARKDLIDLAGSMVK